jgi:hypothetical protein
MCVRLCRLSRLRFFTSTTDYGNAIISGGLIIILASKVLCMVQKAFCIYYCNDNMEKQNNIEDQDLVLLAMDSLFKEPRSISGFLKTL